MVANPCVDKACVVFQRKRGELVMKSFNKKIGIAAMAALMAGQVAAYEAGDFILRAGYAAVDPQESSDDLSVSGVGTLSGTGVGVSSGAALGINGTYMFTSHWGVEVLLATPFTHDVTTKGLGALGVADGTRLGEVTQLPPTVSAQYYFLDPVSKVQPYIGLGINYTIFFDESVSGDAKSALGAENLNLDDSIGLAGEIGIDWRLDDHWLLNASVWRVQIESDASVDTALGRAKTTVSIDPWVYMVGVGYKF